MVPPLRGGLTRREALDPPAGGGPILAQPGQDRWEPGHARSEGTRREAGARHGRDARHGRRRGRTARGPGGAGRRDRSAPEEGDQATPFVPADLATPDGAGFAASQATRILGGLDIVVHCAGASFAKPGGALALTDDDWARVLGLNLLAAVRLDRAVLPGLAAQRSGAIVHVSSLQWKRPHPSSPAYGPAKAALTSYSKVLANEFGPMGVRVNTVTPGYIATPAAEARIAQTMDHAGISHADAEAALLDAIGGVPLGRPGTLGRGRPARRLPGLGCRVLHQRRRVRHRRRQQPGLVKRPGLRVPADALAPRAPGTSAPAPGSTATMEHRGGQDTQIINPQVLLAARFVRFHFMIN